VAIRIADPNPDTDRDTDPDRDPYRETGKMYFGGGMRCPSASSSHRLHLVACEIANPSD